MADNLYKKACRKNLLFKKSKSLELFIKAAELYGQDKNAAKDEIKTYKKIAKLCKNDLYKQAQCYTIIAHIKWNILELYTDALNYYTKSIDIYTTLDNLNNIAETLKYIALMYDNKYKKYNSVYSQIYYTSSDINKAIYMFQQSMNYYKILNDTTEIEFCKNKIDELIDVIEKYGGILSDSPPISPKKSTALTSSKSSSEGSDEIIDEFDKLNENIIQQLVF